MRKKVNKRILKLGNWLKDYKKYCRSTEDQKFKPIKAGRKLWDLKNRYK